MVSPTRKRGKFFSTSLARRANRTDKRLRIQLLSIWELSNEALAIALAAASTTDGTNHPEEVRSATEFAII